MWDDEQIDAAIDETARQLTAGEPGADFRARVMARIDSGSRFRAGFTIRSWRPALAGLSVVALVFAIGLVVVRERPTVRPVLAPRARLAPENGTKPVDVAPKVNAAGTFEVAQRFSPAIAANSVQVRLKPDPAYDIEPLTTPALDLESIAVTALAASDSIDIEPLPPAPSIAVTPLDVENEGDRR
jgi:hypothetical protein